MIGDYIKPCDICGKDVHKFAKLCPSCFGDPNQKDVNYELEALARGAQIAKESHERVQKVLKEYQESKERRLKAEKENKKKAKAITDDDNEISSLLKLGFESIAIDAVQKFYGSTYYEANQYIKYIRENINEGDYDFPSFFYDRTCAAINKNDAIIDIYGNLLSVESKKEYFNFLKKEEMIKDKANNAMSLLEDGTEEKKLVDRFFQLKPIIMKERGVLFKETIEKLKSNIDNGNAEIIKQKKKWFGKDFSDAYTLLHNAEYCLGQLFCIGRNVDTDYNEKVGELRKLYNESSK